MIKEIPHGVTPLRYGETLTLQVSEYSVHNTTYPPWTAQLTLKQWHKGQEDIVATAQCFEPKDPVKWAQSVIEDLRCKVTQPMPNEVSIFCRDCGEPCKRLDANNQPMHRKCELSQLKEEREMLEELPCTLSEDLRVQLREITTLRRQVENHKDIEFLAKSHSLSVRSLDLIIGQAIRLLENAQEGDALTFLRTVPEQIALIRKRNEAQPFTSKMGSERAFTFEFEWKEVQTEGQQSAPTSE